MCRSSPVSFGSSHFARIPRRQVQIIVFQQVDRLLPFLQRFISLQWVIAFQWGIAFQRFVARKQVIAHKQFKQIVQSRQFDQPVVFWKPVPRTERE